MGAREDKLLEAVTRIDTNVAHLLAADEDKEKRVRSLEKWRWVHSVPLAIVGAFIAKKLGLPMSGG